MTRRPRHSPYPMISVKDAVNIVIDHAKVKDTESVAFEGQLNLLMCAVCEATT